MIEPTPDLLALPGSGDLFTQPGDRHDAVTEADIFGPSEMMRAALNDCFALTSDTAATFDKLIATEPRMLACMHGASFRGDGSALLRELSNTLVGAGAR